MLHVKAWRGEESVGDIHTNVSRSARQSVQCVRRHIGTVRVCVSPGTDRLVVHLFDSAAQ